MFPVQPGQRTARVDGPAYSEHVLRRVVSPFFEQFDPERNRYVYQEDNCPVHWSRHTRAVKLELGIPCLDAREWPSNSPDVAVADYFVWPWLMQHVRLFFVCAK